MKLIHEHPIWVALAAQWVFSALIDRLPAPLNPRGFYAYIFGVLHSLASNTSKVQAVLEKKEGL